MRRALVLALLVPSVTAPAGPSIDVESSVIAERTRAALDCHRAWGAVCSEVGGCACLVPDLGVYPVPAPRGAP